MSASIHTAAETPKVEISGLHKFFGELHVLRGIDLIVPPGSVTVLIGPSGSGKSTLLRCINELESIDAGRVKVDGELIGMREVERGGRTELHALSDKARAAQRAKIGMVFQRFNLFPHMTALENVMEAPVQVKKTPKTKARERGIELLERVGLGDRLDHYPPSSPAVSSSGCDRPGAGDGPRAHALRRANLRPGPRAGRRGSSGHEGPGRLRDDDGGGHP